MDIFYQVLVKIIPVFNKIRAVCQKNKHKTGCLNSIKQLFVYQTPPKLWINTHSNTTNSCFTGFLSF
jgi:hypothetical protein